MGSFLYFRAAPYTVTHSGCGRSMGRACGWRGSWWTCPIRLAAPARGGTTCTGRPKPTRRMCTFARHDAGYGGRERVSASRAAGETCSSGRGVGGGGGIGTVIAGFAFCSLVAPCWVVVGFFARAGDSGHGRAAAPKRRWIGISRSRRAAWAKHTRRPAPVVAACCGWLRNRRHRTPGPVDGQGGTILKKGFPPAAKPPPPPSNSRHLTSSSAATQSPPSCHP